MTIRDKSHCASFALIQFVSVYDSLKDEDLHVMKDRVSHVPLTSVFNTNFVS